MPGTFALLGPLLLQQGDDDDVLSLGRFPRRGLLEWGGGLECFADRRLELEWCISKISRLRNIRGKAPPTRLLSRSGWVGALLLFSDCKKGARIRFLLSSGQIVRRI